MIDWSSISRDNGRKLRTRSRVRARAASRGYVILGVTLCRVVMRSRMRQTLLTVRRRCLVCEFEEHHEEPAGTDAIGSSCSSCHAPTERVEIVARHTKPLALNPHAAALGRLGGLKGGPARARTLSAERRREIALSAARKRWGLG